MVKVSKTLGFVFPKLMRQKRTWLTLFAKMAYVAKTLKGVVYSNDVAYRIDQQPLTKCTLHINEKGQIGVGIYMINSFDCGMMFSISS